MPTTKPRLQVTETPEVAHALAVGASLATFDEGLARVARSRGVDVADGTTDGGR